MTAWMTKCAALLTSKVGARLIAAVGVLLMAGVIGALTSTAAAGRGPDEPPGSESARAGAVLAEFPDADRQSLLVVASRDDAAPLAGGDLTALRSLAADLATVTGQQTSPPLVSHDGKAALISVPITVTDSDDQLAEQLHTLRERVAAASPDGLTAQVTGGPAFGVDIAQAFDGADFTLLAVTIAVVAVLLIATYRSPVLWLVPLLVVALADQLANKVTAAAGSALGLHFDAGIISVLVFGAGTNYALLLISRYREELSTTEDHRQALATAWRGAAGAILASNLTVVFSLLTLAAAVIPGTRGLGIASAIGLLIALGAVLLVLPSVLALAGRRIFWPFIPRPDADRVAPEGFWHRIATAVLARPRRWLGAAVVVLLVMGAGLIGTSVGLAQLDKFRVPSESAAGLQTLQAHFPPGEAAPLFVLVKQDQADALVPVMGDLVGVERVSETGRHGGWARLMVVGKAAPDSPESLALVQRLRSTLAEHPQAQALVGGSVAIEFDSRAGNHRDLLLIAPLVLLVSLVVLVALLRSVVAPVILLVINLASATAAIGLGSWLSRVIFDQPALDLQVPLLSFLFLVALGIDYTIFLVHRARHEWLAGQPTAAAMVTAVSRTGGVITSAGVVLAAVFAALGLLPLVTLGQLGLIVGVGVMVDTLLVRSVIVPAVFTVVGERIWWPGRRPQRDSESAEVASTEADERESQGDPLAVLG